MSVLSYNPFAVLLIYIQGNKTTANLKYSERKGLGSSGFRSEKMLDIEWSN